MPTTYPQHAHGAKLKVRLGDGGDPETFSHMVLINRSKTIEGTANMVDNEIPPIGDDDDDKPAMIFRNASSIGDQISGEGVCDFASYNLLDAHRRAGTALNIETEVVGFPETKRAGAFKVSTLNMAGSERQGVITGSITLVSHGAYEPVA